MEEETNYKKKGKEFIEWYYKQPSSLDIHGILNWWLSQLDLAVSKERMKTAQEILIECQKDVDFAAKHQQMVSVMAMSKCYEIIRINTK